MIHGRLVANEEDRCLVPEVMRTTHAFERMRGLLGRPALEPQQALLLAPCSSIHTFGMPYALDVVYLDRDWTIRKLVDNIPPWRLSACFGAAMVVEMQRGRIHELGLRTGQQLRWEY